MKKKLIKIGLLIGLLSICLFPSGCEQDRSNAMKISVDFNESIDLFTSDIIESIQLIELETTEESLIGILGRIVITDNEIFLLNNPNSSQTAILRFGKDGQFYNSIGATGKGPGEFTGVNDFFLNKKTGQIELLSNQNQMFLFELTGEFSGQIKNPNKIPVNSFIKTNEGNYFFYGGPNNGFDNHRMYMVNPEGEIIKSYLGQETNLSPIGNDNNFILSENEIFFRESFNDTIYKFNNEVLEPYCIFELGDYSFPKDIHLYQFEELFSAIKNCAMPVIFHKNLDYLITAFFIYGNDLPVYFILKSKNTKNTRLISMPEVSEFIDSFDGPGYLTDDNEIVFLLNPADIKLNGDKLKKIPLFEEVLSKISNIDENSNPFLVMAKIKEF